MAEKTNVKQGKVDGLVSLYRVWVKPKSSKLDAYPLDGEMTIEEAQTEVLLWHPEFYDVEVKEA